MSDKCGRRSRAGNGFARIARPRARFGDAMLPRLAACLFAIAAPLAAQAVRWQVPERGGLVYARTLAFDSKVVPEGQHCPDPWHGAAQPGVFYAGELDAARVRRAGEVVDVRELLAHVALDLGTARGGKAQLAMARGNWQPVRIDVEYDAPQAGAQAFRGTIAFDQKAARGLGAVAPHEPRIDGTFRGQRTLALEQGRVAAFDGVVELQLEHPAWVEGDHKHVLRKRTLKITDAWQDAAIAGPDDAAFEERIRAAIRASAAHLKQKLAERADNIPAPGANPHHEIAPGELAMMLLALRRSGEDARDAALVHGYDRLRKCVISGTYSLAVAILAMEALYTPAGEWAEMRAGRLKVPMTRQLPAADLAVVKEWSDTLLGNIDTSVDRAYVRRWHYGPGVDWDNSNSQYACLGLYGTQLCGVEVPSQVWTAATQHWLLQARLDGAAESLDATLRKDVDKPGRTRAGGKVQPRGWSYRDDGPLTGSMTTAGIAGLTLCTSALRLQKKGNPKLLSEADASVRAGLLWMQKHMTVRGNPFPDAVRPDWHLYYLYGLERACELNQVALLGGRDWYVEGAMHLVATQNPDGAWGSFADTAFGLLFLMKASLPAITGR